tara:strand:+ start:4999 stop:5418 length:420 start_codon:yes stop_codon:yes gene_type:complete
MEKVAQPWDKVMQAYYKQAVRENKKRDEENKAYAEVFGGIGIRHTCEELRQIFLNGGVIIDVRNPAEHNSGGKIHNAVNVPVMNILRWCDLREGMTENTPILVYSDSGNLANTAKVDLEKHGYKNVTNIGSHKWYNLCS